MAGTVQKQILEKLEYRTCVECKRHPRYPEIPAVTLHQGDLCLVCRKAVDQKPILKDSELFE